MILAVTGGRNVYPTEFELKRLTRACRRRGVRVVRVGCCPTGVDKAVREWMLALPEWRRHWSVEVWRADWKRLGNAAGPRRNGAMLRGDQRGVLEVVTQGTVSVGPVSVLVPWPGGRGTSDCRSQAGGLCRVVPIGQVGDAERLLGSPEGPAS